MNLIKNGTYDLVMLDIVMPGLNGVEVYAQIQKMNLPCKVVVITGYSDDHKLVHRIKKEGVKDLFHKPFDFDAIVDVVKSL